METLNKQVLTDIWAAKEVTNEEEITRRTYPILVFHMAHFPTFSSVLVSDWSELLIPAALMVVPPANFH